MCPVLPGHLFKRISRISTRKIFACTSFSCCSIVNDQSLPLSRQPEHYTTFESFCQEVFQKFFEKLLKSSRLAIPRYSRPSHATACIVYHKGVGLSTPFDNFFRLCMIHATGAKPSKGLGANVTYRRRRARTRVRASSTTSIIILYNKSSWVSASVLFPISERMARREVRRASPCVPCGRTSALYGRRRSATARPLAAFSG